MTLWTIVLDTNEIVRDWTFRSLRGQLLFHLRHGSWFDVVVPAVVVEEVVANHGREVERLTRMAARLDRDRRMLGLPADRLPDPSGSGSAGSPDYRSSLLEGFERLNATVLPWPTVPHTDLVARAVARRAPFDDRGSGYRDGLVWADVIGLVGQGRDVALVSRDKDFGEGVLHSDLQREVDSLPGRVELVADFDAWLLSSLPWKVAGMSEAVAASRTAEFMEEYLQGDLQDYIRPSITELGLRHTPTTCVIDDVGWNGAMETVGSTTETDGLTRVEYELGQDVRVRATFPSTTPLEPGWEVVELDTWRNEVIAEREWDMTVRLAVVFGDDFDLAVQELSWRRTDGEPPGEDVSDPSAVQGQLGLPGL